MKQPGQLVRNDNAERSSMTCLVQGPSRHERGENRIRLDRPIDQVGFRISPLDTEQRKLEPRDRSDQRVVMVGD
jgi:hypothetical protein